MNIKPLGDRVVIKKVEPEQKTKSGIVLPNSAKEEPQMAEVLAVGTGDKIEVSVGDKVIFSKYAGTEVKFEGEELTILNQSDVLAIVK